MSFTHTRTYAQSDSIQVIDGNASWSICRSDDPVLLWLTVDGVSKLMQYDWDADSWAEVTPE